MWTQSECRMQNADEETTDYTDGHGWRDGDAGQDADGEQQIKCITVIHLIRGCAVTTCDFRDARFERWTGGIDRPATRAKQRLLQEATESTESDSGNSLLGSTGHRPTGIELGELTALFSLSSDGGGGPGRGAAFLLDFPPPQPSPRSFLAGRGRQTLDVPMPNSMAVGPG